MKMKCGGGGMTSSLLTTENKNISEWKVERKHFC
jgi:hypothetical protein